MPPKLDIPAEADSLLLWQARQPYGKTAGALV